MTPKSIALSGEPDIQSGQASAYWEQHWKSEAEGERIYQYIADNFDPHYSIVPQALFHLAFFQERQGKHAAALENLKKFEKIDYEQIYSVSRYNAMSQTTESAGERRGKDVHLITAQRRILASSMIRSARNLDPAPAAAELNELKRKYPADAKLQAQIEEGLRNAALRASEAANPSASRE